MRCWGAECLAGKNQHDAILKEKDGRYSYISSREKALYATCRWEQTCNNPHTRGQFPFFSISQMPQSPLRVKSSKPGALSSVRGVSPPDISFQSHLKVEISCERNELLFQCSSWQMNTHMLSLRVGKQFYYISAIIDLIVLCLSHTCCQGNIGLTSRKRWWNLLLFEVSCAHCVTSISSDVILFDEVQR